ncbi:hypothetical protein KKB41_02305 [Patescibacteria group bacterium]|nr:hypothetical protein [Patescibacteria group bacterium]
MKKVLFTIYSLIPGGFLFLGIILLFVGCSHYQYRTTGTQKFRIEGRTSSPESVAIALAEAEGIRADATATRICAQNPQKCQAMALARTVGFYGNGFLDTPYGYTWAGIQAVQNYGVKEKTKKKEEAPGEGTEDRLKVMEKENKKLQRRMKQLVEAVKQ